MFRDGNEVSFVSSGYGGIHDKWYFREDKKSYYDNKEALDIKKEINKLKVDIEILSRKTRKNPTKEDQSLLNKKREDLNFWLNEMSKFDNLPSHKKFKRKTRKVSKDKLKEEVLKLIDEAISKDTYFLYKEDVAYRLKVKTKDLNKIFMELNREGILSQAKHHLMHDSNRDCNYPLLPYEKGDWAADIFYIRKSN